MTSPQPTKSLAEPEMSAHPSRGPVLRLLPVFLTIEATRVALWAARAVHEPDHDGGLLHALCTAVVALLGIVLRLIPSPVWTLLAYALCIAWVPVRGVLWMWGIGRGGLKTRSPSAVTRWYAVTRKRRAKTLRRQQQQ